MGGGMNGEKAPERIDVPAEPKGETMLKGIDVSKWQKGINWKSVKDAGNVFAFAKATDGATGFDPEFFHHRDGAKAQGLLFGAYHFFRFEAGIAEQAANFLKAIGDARGELFPVVDAEWDRYSSHYSEGHSMDAEAADRVGAFVEILIRSGVRPMVYTNAYFWNPGKRASLFQGLPLWVPNYHAKDISGVKIPAPWKRADFWQFSESVKAYGVDAVDANYFLGGREELNKLVRR